MQIKKKYPETLLIFLTPPSAEEIYNRLKGRGTETDEVIAKRMRRAAEEALCIGDYDYLIINDDIDECTARVHNAIQTAHHTVRHEAELIERLKSDLKRYV